MASKPSDWDRWKNHVLLELKRMNENYEDHDAKMDLQSDKIDKMREEFGREISALKVKSGLWGAAAGMLPVLIHFISQKFRN